MERNDLKKFIPFSELEDQYLEDALAQITEKTFHKGEMLFKRGRPVAERYYLLSGRVDLIDAAYKAATIEGGDDKVANTLNPESPTRCSCMAKSLVNVFTIEAEALDRIVSWSQSAAYANEEAAEGLGGDEFMLTGEIEVSSISDEEATDWMSSLLQSPLFTRIPLTQVQELFTRFENIAVEKEQVVVKEGDPGDYFYVLASGRAHVTNRSESVDVVLEPGSYFGEEALLGATPRNATITMLENGSVKKLISEDFEALLKEPILKYVQRDELQTLDKPFKLIDVKMPIEYRLSHEAGSINLPLSRLRTSLSELGKTSAYVVPDDAGSRADIAAHLLCQAGFDAYILKSDS